LATTRTPQRAALGDMLRDLRQRAGMEAQEADAALGWYKGRVSRIETGDRGIAPAEAVELARLYGMTRDRDLATVRQLATEARRREATAHVADFAHSYLTFERQATHIDHFDDVLVHALGQIEPYARALMATATTERLDERVADRMARQAILGRDDPPTVRMLLGESALHAEIGGREVMRAQLAHLLDLMELPSVSVRIVPFAAGAHRALGVGFQVVKVAQPTSIIRVYLEGLTTATYLHDPRETNIYEEVFTQLWDMAASDHESATILRRRIT
jgi:plasmid maintenance system antidote protein VapI